MKKFILISLLASLSFAARLEDVRLLHVNYGKDSFQLRLQTKEGPLDSYFFVDITKDDKDAFDKLMFVIKKLTQRDNYKLDLEIPSFSVSPSGSYYRSNDIKFFSTLEREPNSTKKKSNKK